MAGCAGVPQPRRKSLVPPGTAAWLLWELVGGGCCEEDAPLQFLGRPVDSPRFSPVGVSSLLLFTPVDSGVSGGILQACEMEGSRGGDQWGRVTALALPASICGDVSLQETVGYPWRAYCVLAPHQAWGCE